MKSLIIPSTSKNELLAVTRIALFGALLAGLFGIIHDQVTYSIAPSYFHKFKFVSQFQSCDFGWHPRLFASTVGLLSTWWVGLISGWIIGRIALKKFGERGPRLANLALAGMILLTISFGLIAYFVAPLTETPEALKFWRQMIPTLTEFEAKEFRTVGYIHNAGYLGVALGTCLAIAYLLRKKKF